MKSSFFIVIILLITTFSFTQIPSPVSWSFELVNVDDKHQIVRAKADISENWVVYSSKMDDSGPIPTSMSLDENIEMVGILKEPLNSIKAYDSLFDMEVIKFNEKAIFEQKFVVDPSLEVVQGHIRFMTCDGSRCLPPQNIEFSLPIKR